MRVLIAEDHALMREGLAALLRDAGFHVVGAVSDADQLVELAIACSPDVVIADIRMPPTHTDDGLRAALRIRGAAASIGVMLLSQHLVQSYALALLSRGSAGVGYLLKHRIIDVEQFCADVRRVAAGGSVLDPEVVQAMIDRPRRNGDSAGALTPRQREVLGLMAEGLSNQAIARRLTITEKAVVKHVSHIYDELRLEPSTDEHRRVLAVVRHLTS